MMKRKINYKNLLLLFIVVIVSIAAIFGIYKIVSNFLLNNNNDPIDEVTANRLTIDLVDYQVYRSDEFDFEFVIADLRFSDEKAINYNLANLYTDESIKLNDVSKYVNTLEDSNYFLGVKNVVYSVKSDSNSAIFSIFIPIKDKNKTELTLFDAVSKKEIKIDLNDKLADLKELRLTTGGNITASSYSININDAYIETKFFQNDEPYQYPSTVQIYAFVITIENIEDDVTIEDAVFTPEGSDEKIHALDASITAMRQNNIISRPLSEGVSGALFFEVYSPHDSPVSYQGTLDIKFSDSDEWLSLETELN